MYDKFTRDDNNLHASDEYMKQSYIWKEKNNGIFYGSRSNVLGMFGNIGTKVSGKAD